MINQIFETTPDSLIDYCGRTTTQLLKFKGYQLPINTILTFGPIDGWLYGYTFYSMDEKLIYQIEARKLIITPNGQFFISGTTEQLETNFKILEITKEKFNQIEY